MTTYRIGNTAEIIRKRTALPTLAREILKPLIRRSGLFKRFQRYEFVHKWQKIVGEEMAKRSSPEKVLGRTLIVKVSGSAWAQELMFKKKEILARFRKEFGESCLIDNIQFRCDG